MKALPTAPNQRELAAPQYEPQPFFLVRTPLLPVEAYSHLSNTAVTGERPGERLLTDPRVQRALAVGSIALLDELERQSARPRDRERRTSKLLRYLIRMATRPTPFGLFAGVALGYWGQQTDLALAHTMARIEVRPDMHWLLSLIWRLEALPQVRTHLQFLASTAILFRNGRAYVLDPLASAQSDTTLVPSIRATRAVTTALALARQPISYADLHQALLSTIAGATPEKVAGLIDELWRQGLLMTDLRPVLTGEVAPAWQLQHRLARIPKLSPVAEHLATLLAAIQAWEELPDNAAVAQYRHLLSHMQTFQREVDDMIGPELEEAAKPRPVRMKHMQSTHNDDPDRSLLQVDMGHRLAGQRLLVHLGAEVARLAELLARCSPFPAGLTTLEPFRAAFVDRYGTDREMPLLEVLHPHFGLGDPRTLPKRSVSAQATPLTQQRDQVVLDLAIMALRDRQLVVELDEALIGQLETQAPAHTPWQSSLDLNVLVAAPSAAALDAGDFQVILGPNVGSWQAGRHFGRFARLLGDDTAAALRGMLHREEQLHPEAIWAEMVYLPYQARSANVALRPALRTHELAFGALAGVPHDATIPLDEVVLGLYNHRLYLRWPRHNREIRVCAGHMLNHAHAPALVRFLEQVGLDQMTLAATSFEWAGARDFPFLPRLQSGRLVLSLARWQVTAMTRQRELPTTSPAAFQAALPAWRERWQVPRFVYVAAGDHRLLLDLENPQQSDELRKEISALKERGRVTLEEVLPALDQAWLKGPEGHYMLELSVPLLRRVKGATPQGETGEKQGTPSLPAPVPYLDSIPTALRFCAPGSNWLFLKLYCPEDARRNLLLAPFKRWLMMPCKKS